MPPPAFSASTGIAKRKGLKSGSRAGNCVEIRESVDIFCANCLFRLTRAWLGRGVARALPELTLTRTASYSLIMPASAPQTNLAQWFDWLRTMKADSISGATIAMDLLTFAGTTIVKSLPSADLQGQFILNITNDLHVEVATSDLSDCATFKDLLNHFMLLEFKVADFLQPMAAGTYAGLAAFYGAKTSDAFPGGSVATRWQTANTALVAAFPSECYTDKLQKAAAKTVDDNTKKIADLVAQIAALG